MEKGSSRFRRDTWMKLIALGRSEDEFEVAYAKIIAKLVHYRIEKELTQSELAEKKWIICYYDFEHRKFT